jgi:hypothetical protein
MFKSGIWSNFSTNFLQYKKQRRPPGKKKNRGKNVSPRNRKVCDSISAALLSKLSQYLHFG